VFLLTRRKASSESLLRLENTTESSSSRTSSYKGSVTPDRGMLTNVQVKQEIGKGAFGQVFMGLWNSTPVALKTLDKSQAAVFEQELAIITKLNHPNVVSFFGLHQLGPVTYLVMEYCQFGSLDKFLQKNPHLSQESLFALAFATARGMLFLSGSKILHNDLACRNLLVQKLDNRFTVKVTDFGLSRFSDKNYERVSPEALLPIRWAAPEIWTQGVFSTKSDVWSYGVTVWEMYSGGKVPYAGVSNTDLRAQVPSGLRETRPVNCPESIFAIVEECWNLKPSERLDFTEIVDTLSNLAPVEKASRPLPNAPGQSEAYYANCQKDLNF